MSPDRKQQLLTEVQYPSMTALESAVAHAWIAKHADEWDDVEFNVRSGSALDIGPEYSSAVRQQAALNSQKRIDMVATRGRRSSAG